MSSAPQILVVDHDPGITTLLCAYLARFGFGAHVAASGAQMQQQLATQQVDLVVLDLMLPDVDGLALVHALRAASRIPVIVLTARGSPADRVVGLEMGADDYMSKPFEPRELVARIQSVLRRSNAARGVVPPPFAPSPTHSDTVAFDGWALQRSERRLLSPKGAVVPLSNAEYQLLATFLKTPRRVVSRDQLAEQARGRSGAGLERSIDMLVSRLRQKLLDGSEAGLIQTVRGAGYLFNAKSVQSQPGWG